MTRLGTILISLGLAATLFFGSAFAAIPAVLVDDTVDYTDAEITTAYVSFTMEGATLTVTLNHDANSELPAIAFTVPALDHHDIFGNEVGADIDMIADVDVNRAGSKLTSLEVTHLDVDLRELADTYQSLLASLGFETSLRIHTNHNVATLDASTSEGALRVVLHRSAGGVEAHLFPL